MDLATRDAYVISQLAKFKAAGMTDRQAVQEVLRTSGFDAISLPGYDVAALDEDVSGLQTAIADIVTPSVRATSTAELNSGNTTPASGKLPTTAMPHGKGNTKASARRMRVIAAGG